MSKTVSTKQEKRPVSPPKGIDEIAARRRIIIEGVKPEVDAGRYPIKRVQGDRVLVEVNLVADGHDELAGVVRFRHSEAKRFSETPLEPLGNDRWRAAFTVTTLGRYLYTFAAWVDHFASWRAAIVKKAQTGENIEVDMLIGAALIREAAQRAKGEASRELRQIADRIGESRSTVAKRIELVVSERVRQLMQAYPNLRYATEYPRELGVVVDRKLARFGAWYEMFPRSCTNDPNRHGTFKDCEKRLAYVASMGFDIVYLPPIHPIGTTHRKGKNNSVVCTARDPGCPWAIGDADGGHKAVHRELGSLEEFRSLTKQAEKHGLEIALDIAFQASPDHPYVKAHPSWFRQRPDGSVQYAENPPKKYQDLYPLNFDTDDWPALWSELKSIFDFWIEQGVRIFRVDNPHTKPFVFWEWLISQIKARHPDVILLSEAFTRPKIMYALSKLGFTQSYTYFTWRNTKKELTEYLTELTRTEVFDFFGPNLWTNTPDILHEVLQHGGRPAFISRLVLAATLGTSYGVYGPAFELCINTPREPGSEEYLDSEKYEIKAWQLDRPESLRGLIAQINRIRNSNEALHSNHDLVFHPTDNDHLICYSKRSADRTNTLLVAVNLDYQNTQSGRTNLSLNELGLGNDQWFEVTDLLTGASYSWHGAYNYIELNPGNLPAHIFLVRY
ncbi:MAG: alpha-1,4-glucan--maltose-1-phosphate maltosyltransferase [Deltaproteobacteria bacterium]|nr:alpha-1,4-glucan--maltose-1-phosphate maltosyltransferase [Deltaproteobacteria bacterium]